MSEWLLALTQGVLTLAGVAVGAILAARLGRSATYLELKLNRMHDTYASLADYVVRLRAAALVPGVEQSETLLASLVDDDKAWWSLQAGTAIYGSKPVLEKFDELLRCRVRLSAALSTWRDARGLPGPPDQSSKDALEAVRSRRADAARLCEEVLTLLNAELRTPHSIHSVA